MSTFTELPLDVPAAPLSCVLIRDRSTEGTVVVNLGAGRGFLFVDLDDLQQAARTHPRCVLVALADAAEDEFGQEVDAWEGHVPDGCTLGLDLDEDGHALVGCAPGTAFEERFGAVLWDSHAATPTCAEPGSFSDAQGHAACLEHGGVAPRNLPADVRRLVASAATRRDYGAIARVLGDADVDLAWLAEELTQTERPRAHALAVDLVRLGVEPHLLVPSLPPRTLAASPRAQLRRDRVARAVRALHSGPTVDAVPDELRDCYRRHGEVLAERNALQQRVAELEARVAALEEERDGLAAGLRRALTYDQFSDL